uniref:G-protein coupled receptors family 1 profile domain-containing protein n=1 Tax=Clytia hemisphaerica TaxID=252671 RepID=A0A7M5WRX1_9CNID
MSDENYKEEEEENLNCIFQQTSGLSDPYLAHVIPITVTLFVISSNIMLIYGVLKTNRNNLSISNKLFILLSIYDCVVVSAAFAFTYILTEKNIDCGIIVAFLSINNATIICSCLTFSLISLLRCFNIKRPFQHIPTKLVYVTIGCIAVFSISIALVLAWQYKNMRQETFQKIQLLTSLSMFLLVDFILFINIISYLYLKKNSQRFEIEMQTYNNTETNTPRNTSLENKKSAGKTLLLISFFYSLCMMPFPLFVIWSLIDRTLLESSLSVKFLNYCYNIVILNGGINSTIYILRNKKIRILYFRFCSRS